MLANVIGIHGVDYINGKGEHVIGMDIYYVYNFPRSQKNCDGVQSAKVWISGGTPLFDDMRLLKVGSRIDVNFDVSGKYPRLSDIEIIDNPDVKGGVTNDA